MILKNSLLFVSLTLAALLNIQATFATHYDELTDSRHVHQPLKATDTPEEDENSFYNVATISKLSVIGALITGTLLSYEETPRFDEANLLAFSAYGLITYSLGEPYYTTYFIDPMMQTWKNLRRHSYMSSAASIGALLHYYNYEIINQPFLLCAVPLLFVLNHPERSY